MNFTIVAFAVVLTIVAILTKIIGCGIGAKMLWIPELSGKTYWYWYDFAW